MAMMRIRGVWTTNLAAFLLGAGMYSSFIVFPQFAQLPKSTGFGFGASVVVSGLYLLPCALGMGLLGTVAGRVARRFGSKLALVVGTAVTAVGVRMARGRPRPPLRHADQRDTARGRDRARVRGAREPDRAGGPAEQTGVASGMNTVMRTLGGALGGQISATFIVDNTAHGLPTVTGFTDVHDGSRVPDRLRCCRRTRTRHANRERIAETRRTTLDRPRGRIALAVTGAARASWSAPLLRALTGQLVQGRLD